MSFWDDVIRCWELMICERAYLATLTVRKPMSCSLFEGYILDLDNLTDLMDGVDVVYHMAANADISGENENHVVIWIKTLSVPLLLLKPCG